MSGVTEIYVCKAGQELKQGALETSTRISTKDEAECDAEQRCKLDPSIERIAYYAVDEGGTFRNFLIYKNPRSTATVTAGPPSKPRAARTGAGEPARAPVRRSTRKPTLFQKVRALFEED